MNYKRVLGTTVFASKANDYCSDDDVDKGSDDVVNVIPNINTNTQTMLPNRNHTKCSSTLVFAIGIVLTIIISVTTLVVSLTDEKNNSFHSKEDILRLSDQLNMISSEMKSYCLPRVEPNIYEKVSNEYLYHVLQEENKRLKDILQKEKSEKDFITHADAYKKRINRKESQELLHVGCRLVTSTNHHYSWVFANKSLTFGRTENFITNLKIKILYPEIPDNDKILFEFGLTTVADYLKMDRPVIIFSGQRCVESPGICLGVIDDTFSKLKGPHFEQISDYIQGQLTLELHKSYLVLTSNHKNIFVSNVLNISSEEELWPVFRFYNTHLINISQTIFSENKLSFNLTTVDPHLFVSEDNNTIANYKLQHSSGWHISVTYLEITVAIMCPVIIFLLNVFSKPIDILLSIAVIVVACLFLLLVMYYLYMHFSLILVWIVGLWLFYVLKEHKNKTFDSNITDFIIVSIFFSTYIMSFFKAISHIY